MLALDLILYLMPGQPSINVYSSELNRNFGKHCDAMYGPFFHTKCVLLCLLRSLHFMFFFFTEKNTLMNDAFSLTFPGHYIASLSMALAVVFRLW